MSNSVIPMMGGGFCTIMAKKKYLAADTWCHLVSSTAIDWPG